MVGLEIESSGCVQALFLTSWDSGGVAFIYHVTWDYLLPVSSHVLQFLMSKMGYFLIEIKVIKTIK